MSRSLHHRQQQQLPAQLQMAENEAAAAASEMFDLFCGATTMRQVLGLHRNMCDTVGLRPAPLNEFYPKLKAKIRSWKAQALWKKFDARAVHRAYAKGNACTGTRVLVIGAGPCGLRTAIEAQLLGAKVVVIEKRDRISRNNVLHLWPFVITDLRSLGAKKFYGKFCAGSIDHISIRQLQCILLKVALLLGVEVHEGVSFEKTVEPNDGCGWRAHVSPENHAVSHYEFDVLIGADGKRNTLEGFKRKEFRGKLAIAITANFINKKTEAEAKAEEISGVAFIFNQSFFKELYRTTGIDLENIVYYKDETHYFVMTAKKHSLIDKGVIMQDFADPAELLAQANVNTEKLLDYAREAAEFSTKYQMPNLEFAVNHYGKPDVAMFDFTSMFAAETSCRVIVRRNNRLLQCLVGDSLLEPFWPTGSGCARGFLSSMDAAYAIKLWANPRNSTLGVLAQRESIYRLLAQTTPENLQRDIGSYTVDPATRYPNLNRTSVNVWQIKHLIDTDDASILEQTFMDTNAMQISQVDTPIRRKRRNADALSLSTVLLRWVTAQLCSYDFGKNLNDVSECFTNGKVICALINRYRPELIDFNAVKDLTPIECNEKAFKILEEKLHISRIMSGDDSMHLDRIDSKIWLNYLEQIWEIFRGEIPHVKHPKLDVSELREKNRNATKAPDFSKLLQITSVKKAKSPMQEVMNVQSSVVVRRSAMDEEKFKRHRKHEIVVAGGGQQANSETPRRAKKRRSAEKTTNIEEREQRLREIEENRQDRLSKRRQQRYQQSQNFYKSLQMLQANTALRESDESCPFEDYSIYMYRQQAPVFNDRVKELERKLLHPDRERGIPLALSSGTDEHFSNRIKSMEQRITSRNPCGTDKKPKDLMRAIGKIDSNDWNVREIEKKIQQSKKTEITGPKGREKVPKWNKEQFAARQNKILKPNRQNSGEEKFKEIDQTLKNLDKQLKEGNVLEIGERGRNKVASIAGQFVKKDDTSDEKNPPTLVPKSSSKVALAFKKQAASEKCHFCKQTVYLMEKISTEGLILHRSCLKCHHCHTNLRLGGYAFDRDDPVGRFYCTQHFRLPAKAIRPVVRKTGQKKSSQQHAVAETTAIDAETPEKLRRHTGSVAQLDLLDRGQTPERIEFENTDAMSDGEPSEEHIIDENEWSGRNFLPESDGAASALSSSDDSDDESDSDIFEEPNEFPIAAQTLKLATDWIGKQHYTNTDDSDDDFYDSSEGLIDDGKDDTEGEEFKIAREMRREEVRLLPLPANLPTDTETEVQSESETSSEVEHNSATEISTDSEFDHDEFIRETPKIYIDDTHLRKPTKVHIKSTMIAHTAEHKINYTTNNTGTTKINNNVIIYNNQIQKKHNQQSDSHNKQPHQREPQFKPLVQVDPALLTTNRIALQNPRQGDYLLNKTASTEGIASKKSLELKKRYLLGEQAHGHKIQKSDSTSVLDSKFRSFHSNISECQKLLNPASDISPSMKTFLDRTKLGENSSGTSGVLGTTTTTTTTISNSSSLTPLAPCNLNKKVDISTQKTIAGSEDSLEKENIFVNSQNELNKGMEYSDTINTVLVEAINKKKQSPPNIETVDLITPEKAVPIIDLTKAEIPSKMLESSKEFINNMQTSSDTDLTTTMKSSTVTEINQLSADSNKIIDLSQDSPVKSDKTILDESHYTSPTLLINKPDVSKDIMDIIPDIIEHIEDVSKTEKLTISDPSEDREKLLNDNDEKRDSPEKEKGFDNEVLHETSIHVPNIPWNNRKKRRNRNVSESSSSTDTFERGSSTPTDASSSSIEDIQHYILDSTTSPDTQTNHLVPRLEVHDSSGTLMQIDSLMIIDGKYIGDPEDLKMMEIPKGLILPEIVMEKSSGNDEKATAEPLQLENFPESSKENASQPSTADQLASPMKPDRKFDTKNENKVDTLKNIPLIVYRTDNHTKAVKPSSLNIKKDQKSIQIVSPIVDKDKTPTAELISKGSDSETEITGQVLTETELSDWTADDCISENFIDMEFVLNSNKGTIKRNKKAKRKTLTSVSNMKQLPMPKKTNHPSETTQCEGILKNLDIEEIEFMDTGSEGSCAESYSATNAVILRNCGYMKFNENTTPSHDTKTHLCKVSTSPSSPYHYSYKNRSHSQLLKNPKSVFETPNASYNDQDSVKNNEQDLRTPVNEVPPPNATLLPTIYTENEVKLQTITNLKERFGNDIDDDSLCVLTNSQGTSGLTNATTSTTTTTEESEALTIVTSPLDSLSPKTQNNIHLAGSVASEKTTPSSSENNRKTSTASTSSNSSAANKTPTRKSSHDDDLLAASALTMTQHRSIRKEFDEISYKDYVRKLQQKITQISNARDSIDIRKQKRRSLKGETVSDTTSVIESNKILASGSNLSVYADSKSIDIEPKSQNFIANTAHSNVNSTIHKIPEIPTLTRKLEEITKERTKQKDLIHDLVMDKLQFKKQLNAEKRLTRSRNRTLFSSSASRLPNNSNELNSSQKTTLVNGASCTNSPHYHQASSIIGGVDDFDVIRKSQLKSPSPKKEKEITQMFSKENVIDLNKQRLFSEYLDPDSVDVELSKLSKTNLSTSCSINANRSRYDAFAVPPSAPSRFGRVSRQNSNETAALTASTEKLRSEARARARLKSNHDLGLSPEEKLQALRKRYHLETQHRNGACAIGKSEEKLKKSESLDQHEAILRTGERKMVSSKSVNDIAGVELNQFQSNEILSRKQSCGESIATAVDFTSDPNLSQASTSGIQSTQNKISSRHKDPERRRSIIQTFSSFFQKGGKSKDGGTTNTTATANVPQTENPSSSCNNIIPTAGERVFSRFRISPKSKEKSKDKDRLPIAISSTSLLKHQEQPKCHHQHQHNHHQHNHHIPNHLHQHHGNNSRCHERSNSQDCIAKNQIYKMSSKSSVSSPQLFKIKTEEPMPPPIPPLPLNYQRSDDESPANESREQKKQRAISKAVRQAELKRLRIAQEIQREQEEIEVQLKELEARGVLLEKALRGEQISENADATNICAVSDEKLLKELLEIWRNITHLKKRDEELGIRQQELQLEHRHAQLKEELNIRLSSSKLEKSSTDVAAEGAILNEMLEIVAKRAALRPTNNTPTEEEAAGTTTTDVVSNEIHVAAAAEGANENSGCVQLKRRHPNRTDESDI